MFLIESRSSKRLTLFHVNASLKTNYVPSVCDGGLYSVISLPGNSDGHVLVHWNGPQFCPAVLARVTDVACASISHGSYYRALHHFVTISVIHLKQECCLKYIKIYLHTYMW